MSSSDSMKTRYQVVCVCGGYGFPLGNASAARILMVGKAVQEAGIAFHVLHCGPSPSAVNKHRVGVYEGVSFNYTTRVKRPINKFARLLVYLWALTDLTFRLVTLRRTRRSTVVYLYVQDGQLNLYVGILCQLLGLPLAQEFCEWLPGNPSCSVFNRWLYNRRIFKAATGALVISKMIETRVRERSARANRDLLIHRLPVIVDAQRFAFTSCLTDPSKPKAPNFVWCGTWFKDILFVIRAFALVRLQNYECKLTIIGESRDGTSLEILSYAAKEGLLPEDITLTGSVDHSSLAKWNKSAAALLMPLWNDDQSMTRLPNKMGEYLASGRPVITSKIGDLTDYLIDDVNAYVGRPGCERDFAERMMRVLRDPDRAEQIGVSGQHTCFAHLDYRSHIGELAKFFVSCIESYDERSCGSGTISGEQWHATPLYPPRV